MIIGGRNPIFIKNASKVPESVTSDDDKRMLKLYSIITYEVMNQCNITMDNLFEMGCDIKLVLHSWAQRPCATNLKFENSSKKTILATYNALQNEFIGSLFNINWFDIGMNVGHLISMQLPVPVLKVFNINCQNLVEHNAHEHAETWQSLFNWTISEWEQLGYKTHTYRQSIIADQTISQGKKDLFLKWGPRLHKNTS
jgi:hypothetical protein